MDAVLYLDPLRRALYALSLSPCRMRWIDSGAKSKVPWLVASTQEVMHVAGMDVRGGQLENYVARFQVGAATVTVFCSAVCFYVVYVPVVTAFAAHLRMLPVS